MRREITIDVFTYTWKVYPLSPSLPSSLSLLYVPVNRPSTTPSLLFPISSPCTPLPPSLPPSFSTAAKNDVAAA